MNPLADFSQSLLKWYDLHGRKSLPWHADKDPYKIWVSEIMLQQTQVVTATPYFRRFIARFPDVITLANAPQDDVLHHWSGLGYYARARNLHKAAQRIRDEFDGVFPKEYEQVVGLPGIGRSTAGAILSFSMNQRHPILDGNVKRVLTRYFGIGGYPGKKQIENQLWKIADELTPNERVSDYTQAVMDLGATLCTRSKPKCERCPFATHCFANLHHRQDEFPHRKPKASRPKKRVTMLVIMNGENEIFVTKRPPSGIWGGLWGLPEITDENEPVNTWCDHNLGFSVDVHRPLPDIKHGFSHYDLLIQPVLCSKARHNDKVRDQGEWQWYDLCCPPAIGLPRPIEKIFRNL